LSAINHPSIFVVSNFRRRVCIDHPSARDRGVSPAPKTFTQIGGIQSKQVANVDKRKNPLAIIANEPRLGVLEESFLLLSRCPEKFF
jgi:hypothetical protein